ncbi:NAD(P)H-dependent flavin oxidoreductase [Granulosicoccus sp. 3-233]|uniref:NAD(P)H-dependent flavin oxidoreductase n=1 Tax=Granulosicoccus sp. 3-233 TaxID=3417969 RepID=UPI003D32D156
MKTRQAILERSSSFARRLQLRVPILLAPMAGACPVSLSVAVANAGGMGACGTLLMSPTQISDWVLAFRESSNGCFQLNNWIPDPVMAAEAMQERQLRTFLASWEAEMGGSDSQEASSATPDFEEQCEAMLAAEPAVISSIMGVYPEPMVAEMKHRGILWFATATTVAEAIEAATAGADVIVAQGMEAGGHRGAFNPADAETSLVGLFSLLPAIVDAVDVPVVATGGISDARGVAAALMLGASGVQVGTGFLRADESGIAPVWADAIARTAPEDTVATRAFSGRLGRSIRTRYVTEASAAGAPAPAPYPMQRALTKGMRDAATRAGNLDGMQVWAGQSSKLARAAPAEVIVDDLWLGALDRLT